MSLDAAIEWDCQNVKGKDKYWYDKRISNQHFEPWQKVLIFNARLKFFLGKLKSIWLRLYVISKVENNGTIELENNKKERFVVNGHQVKHYYEEPLAKEVAWMKLRDAP